MATEQQNKSYSYPDHGIDPKLKTDKWILSQAQAAWMDSYRNVRHMFAAARDRYELNRMYALCKQPTANYIQPYKVEGSEDESYLQIDARPRAFVSKYRDSMVAKMMQQEYRPTATPIDGSATDTNNQMYAKLKATLAMKEQLQQGQNPALAGHPAIKVAPTDPQDQEELDMRSGFGEQFNRSFDAENVIALAFYENDIKGRVREAWARDFIDYGVGGFKDELNANNRPVARPVNIKKFIPQNYCEQPDFSDLQGGGEVVSVPKTELLANFSQEQIDRIPTSAGQWPSIGNYGNSTPDDKMAQVWDYCFYSTNKAAYKKGITKLGNVYVNRTDPNKKDDGIETKTTRVVYCCKWVIGTDLVYNCGLLSNMKRSADPKKVGTTLLPFHFYAYNFSEMSCQSYMDRLIPIIDEAMHIVCKMQQFRYRMIPNGFSLDLSVMEETAAAKGGEGLTPQQQLAMYVQTGLAAWRSQNFSGNINNYKPFEKMENSNANEIMGLWNDLNSTLGQMSSLTGFNELTDGSTPNSKTLVPVAAGAQEGTNNALFPLYNSMQHLELSCAENMLLRSKQSIKINGDYSGFVPALNGTSMKFVDGDKDLTLLDHGIMLDIMATDAQRQFIISNMQQDIAQGLLDTSDIIQILFTFNVKQVGMMLALKVKRGKAIMQQQQMAMNQQTIQGQQQSAQMTAQGQAQNLQLEYQLKGQLEDKVQQGKMALLELQLKAQYDGKVEDNHGKVVAKHIEAQGKRDVANIAHGNDTGPDQPEPPQAPPPPQAMQQDPPQDMSQQQAA